MTVASTVSRIDYAGAGTTGPFPYPFKIFDADDLDVFRISSAGVETTLTRVTDYSVDGVNDKAGGSVTLVTALAVGESLTIVREVDLLQPTPFRTLGAFLPASHEDAFDRITMILQQLDDANRRSARISEALDPADYDLELPRPIGGQVLAWNALGTALETRVVSDSAVALPPGRLVTSLSTYLANNARFNVKDYGALGDGLTNDTVAIQAALTACGAAGGGVVWVPAGTYLIHAQLTITGDRTKLMGEGEGISIIKVATAAPYFQNMLVSTGRASCQIADLEFDSNSPARLATIGLVAVTTCIFPTTSTDLRISRVTVRNTVGGSSGSGVGIGIAGAGNVRVVIEQCKALDCGIVGRNSDGIYLGGCEQGRIVDCIAKNCLDTGFVLESCNYSGTSDCTAYNCGLGAAISATLGVAQTGNYIVGLAVFDWSSVNTGGVGLLTLNNGSQLNDTLIANVTMRHVAGVGPAVKAWRGTGDGTLNGVTILGVLVDGSAAQGIVLINCTDAVVANCNVRQTDGISIQVDDGCTNVLVVGCRATMKNGVTVGMCTNGSPDAVTFDNCSIRSGTGASYGIYHFGTGTNLVDVNNTIRGTYSQKLIGADSGSVPDVMNRGLFRSAVDGWTAASTPASQTNVALVKTGGDYTVLRSGFLTGVGLRLSGNAAGGTATVTVYKNGLTTGLSAVVAIASSFATAVPAVQAIPVVAGDIIACRITTPAGFTSIAVIPFASITIEV